MQSRSHPKRHQPGAQNLQELIQASKLALLGQLAAGIAHELRNPLAVICLECDEIGRKIETLPSETRGEWSDHCNAVKRNIAKMLDIVERIRSMSAKPSTGFSKLNIHDVLKEAEEITSHLVKPAKIRLSVDAKAANPGFFGNKTQMEEVFLNLIRNSVDAIQSSGLGSCIRVRTRSVNGSVLIEVSDDGPGITSQDLPMVFEPFFTTKKDTEGAGLGLSIVAQILQEHGGAIDVDSQPGKGVRFRITLPHDRRHTARKAS